MLQKIKCFFGFHVYEHRFFRNRHGFAMGDCCIKCGFWGKASVRSEWPKDGEE